MPYWRLLFPVYLLISSLLLWSVIGNPVSSLRNIISVVLLHPATAQRKLISSPFCILQPLRGNSFLHPSVFCNRSEETHFFILLYSATAQRKLISSPFCILQPLRGNSFLHHSVFCNRSEETHFFIFLEPATAVRRPIPVVFLCPVTALRKLICHPCVFCNRSEETHLCRSSISSNRFEEADLRWYHLLVSFFRFFVLAITFILTQHYLRFYITSKSW
jgi:hypothetical protein